MSEDQKPPDSPMPPTEAEFKALVDAQEKAAALNRVPESDLANAECMAIRYGNEIIYVPGMGFFLYRDGRYQRDPKARQVRYLAGLHAKAVTERALASSVPGKQDPILRMAQRYQSDRAIKATVSLLETLPAITVPATRLNRDPLLFNVANGTVDLRTGLLKPHDPADLITQISPVTFDPAAECPQWIDFVNKISAPEFDGPPRPDLVALLQRLAGYLLTGETKEQMLFLFLGEGANGKGTWVETISAVLGDYATTTNSITFMRTKNEQHPTAVADIAEARFVYCDELAEDAMINEERLKSMTGEGRQKARFMRENFFEFIPRFKVIFGTNHLPKVPTTDQAIWRRIIPIPFSVTIPSGRRDRDIVKRLKEELPGILNWAIAGCRMWQQSGLDPNSLSCVRDMREEYHEEEDHVGAILNAICEFAEGLTEIQTTLYMAYRRACKARGIPPLDGSVFGRRLGPMGYEGARVGKAGTRIRKGLRLQTVVETSLREADEEADPDEEP